MSRRGPWAATTTTSSISARAGSAWFGDVSGKGLCAALLMAHLQATVRSLSARLAVEDLTGIPQGVNHWFWESTAGNHFATLFVAHYEDATRRLRYANCGHPSPALLRAGGAVERLAVTGGAIGLFEAWHCAARDLTLEPGDLLTIFSDGITEAIDGGGQEFGEDRLPDVLGASRTRPLHEIAARIAGDVRGFGVEQYDDLTLVLVCARERHTPLAAASRREPPLTTCLTRA